jgi:integrase/recombinase XerC
MRDVQLSPNKGTLKIRNQSLNKRVVPLNKQAREALKRWLDIRPETSSQAVFIEARPGGTRLSRRAVQGRISKIGKAANVKVTVHLLRHTVARQLLDAGEELETVARLLGHRDLNSTRQYITGAESDLEKAVNLL